MVGSVTLSAHSFQPIWFPTPLGELTAAADQLQDPAARLLRGGYRHAAARAFAAAVTAIDAFEQLQSEWGAAHADTLLP